MYSVNVYHGIDESTIDEPFHAEDIQLNEPRGFLVIAWSAIEKLRIEKKDLIQIHESLNIIKQKHHHNYLIINRLHCLSMQHLSQLFGICSLMVNHKRISSIIAFATSQIIKGSSFDTISVVYTISPDGRRIPTFHNSAAKQITSFQPKGSAFAKVSGPYSFNNYMF
ncbi:MAG: hypothetical protein EZS28_049769 [Streblomastix strix]|uniref:Uncharacterized protein n=1 Tax=Streblomastix strix TaxID=222440 RepID=A0A5J4TB94_9EUKA|nr:MAG: hypothetical protein EZS28_049769 [Streblomastix strix]